MIASKLISIELVIPSNHLIICCSLFLLPSIFPSIRGFLNESALCVRWLKYWSFSFSISPSNEHPGLISFKMDWLDLLAVASAEFLLAPPSQLQGLSLQTHPGRLHCPRSHPVGVPMPTLWGAFTLSTPNLHQPPRSTEPPFRGLHRFGEETTGPS